jgi:hypothetical protein
VVFDEPLPFDPGPDVGGRVLQEEVFADGEVTFDEYERAMTAAAQCMRDGGFDVEGPLRYPEGGLAVEPGVDPSIRLDILALAITGDASDRYGEVNGRCQAQWSYAIETVWFRQNAPTEEEIQAWLDRAWDCLDTLGVPVSNPPTVEEAVGSVAHGCKPWESD